MKIAIVHDYLYQFGGAEKVVEKWLEMYPDADIYTSLYTPDKFDISKLYQKANQEKRIQTTWLNKFFNIKILSFSLIVFFKHFFWLYPIVMSFIVVKDYDVVIISSTFCAKNVRYKNCKKIIHYCHSPVRFLHGLTTETDHKTLNKFYRTLIPIFTFYLKWMDLKAVKYLNSQGCVWIANSTFIQKTIQDVYNTNSTVIYPPTEINKFLQIERKSQDYYLSHGRISFHKRIDLAIKVCLELGKKLKISGSAGFKKEIDDLQKIVADFESQNPDKKGLIEFLGRTTDEQYVDLISNAKAFLFPGKEDAGITPIEMLAAGLPVVAFEAGGALEYIQDGVNGIFFKNQNVEDMKNAILKFEQKTDWNTKQIKDSSLKFGQEQFVESFNKLVK